MKVKHLIINEKDKTTTLVTEVELEGADRLLADIFEYKPTAVKTFSVKCGAEDSYDKYVGAALALVEAQFGSKACFRKWVDKNTVSAKSKEDKQKAKQERVAKAKAKAAKNGAK